MRSVDPTTNTYIRHWPLGQEVGLASPGDDRLTAATAADCPHMSVRVLENRPITMRGQDRLSGRSIEYVELSVGTPRIWIATRIVAMRLGGHLG